MGANCNHLNVQINTAHHLQNLKSAVAIYALDYVNVHTFPWCVNTDSSI